MVYTSRYRMVTNQCCCRCYYLMLTAFLCFVPSSPARTIQWWCVVSYLHTDSTSWNQISREDSQPVCRVNGFLFLVFLTSNIVYSLLSYECVDVSHMLARVYNPVQTLSFSLIIILLCCVCKYVRKEENGICGYSDF